MPAFDQNSPLDGYTIALPETRQLDVMEGLLLRRGAVVRRCPLISILDAPNSQPVIDALQRFIDQPERDFIVLTGEGLRRITALSHRVEMNGEWTRAIARARLIVRGPKPIKALKDCELRPLSLVRAEAPTTEGVIATLKTLTLQEHVTVQLYGTDPNQQLIDYLQHLPVHIDRIAPYVYADESSATQVVQLIQDIVDGSIQAIAFTSQPQVKRLLAVAKNESMDTALLKAMNSMMVASVGPIVSACLSSHGIRVDVMPEDSFFMKPLVTAITEKLMGERTND